VASTPEVLRALSEGGEGDFHSDELFLALQRALDDSHRWDLPSFMLLTYRYSLMIMNDYNDDDGDDDGDDRRRRLVELVGSTVLFEVSSSGSPRKLWLLDLCSQESASMALLSPEAAAQPQVRRSYIPCSIIV